MPNIMIASYSRALTLLGLPTKNFQHVISINDPSSHPPETLVGHQARVLVLYFHDISEPLRHCATAPSRDDVHAIVHFARRIRPEDSVLVHCAAGISRSSAAALILFASFLKPSKAAAKEAISAVIAAKENIFPNRIMLGHADDLLGYHGELILAAAETWE